MYQHKCVSVIFDMNIVNHKMQPVFLSLSDEAAEHSSEYGQLLRHHPHCGSELSSQGSLYLRPSRYRGDRGKKYKAGKSPICRNIQ